MLDACHCELIAETVLCAKHYIIKTTLFSGHIRQPNGYPKGYLCGRDRQIQAEQIKLHPPMPAKHPSLDFRLVSPIPVVQQHAIEDTAISGCQRRLYMTCHGPLLANPAAGQDACDRHKYRHYRVEDRFDHRYLVHR